MLPHGWRRSIVLGDRDVEPVNGFHGAELIGLFAAATGLGLCTRCGGSNSNFSSDGGHDAAGVVDGGTDLDARVRTDAGTDASTDAGPDASRDAEGRLVVNAGPVGSVTFESEFRDTYPVEGDISGCTPADRVAYDWTRDGYEGLPLGSCRTRGACGLEDQDLAHPVWSNGAYRHVLVKNWQIKNAFKTTSAPHVDVTQVLDSPGWGGWFVVQDSTFKNSDDGLVQWQFGYLSNSCPAYQGKPQNEFSGIVVQGVTLNQEPGFVADCIARDTDSVCNQGNNLGSYNGPNVGWFINYQTNGWGITLQQNWEKIVVVGNLPDFGFRANDAYAFSTENTCTGDPCAYDGRVFGPYLSIEAALADGHDEPPFVRLSPSGWVDSNNYAPGAQASGPPAGW
jgi:hypothetical protein